MKKLRLNPIEARIITVLVREGDYMNTTEISNEAKVSWNTALAYLKRLERRGWVESAGDTKKHWRAIVSEDNLD